MNFYSHPIDSDNDIKRLFTFLSLPTILGTAILGTYPQTRTTFRDPELGSALERDALHDMTSNIHDGLCSNSDQCVSISSLMAYPLYI